MAPSPPALRYITAPSDQGTNSFCPYPCSSLLVWRPEAVSSMRRKMRSPMASSGTATHAAFDEGCVDIVLRSRIGLLEFLLSGEARRAERRIHQHDVKAGAQQVNQRDALRCVARK